MADQDRRKLLILLWLVTLAAVCPSAVAEAAEEQEALPGLLLESSRKYRGGDEKAALELADMAISEFPREPSGYLLRAQIHMASRRFRAAIEDYGAALAIDGELEQAYQGRGEARFRDGDVPGSIVDFERLLKIAPGQRPYLWQLGISYYLDGRFQECKRQFEIHQTVNSNDVENAVWHLLCHAQLAGFEASQRDFIPIDGDPRLPMMEVHRLFLGDATPEEVLAAAEKPSADSASGGLARFYAHLYLGLYYEARGDEDRARDHILRSAGGYADSGGYMRDVAVVFAKTRGWD